MTLKELQKACHENAVKHGFWEGELNNNVYVKIALFHSEISEFLEEIRSGYGPCEHWIHDEKPVGPAVELADLIIRVLDCCGAWGIDIEDVIARKMLYNESRPRMHGRKV